MFGTQLALPGVDSWRQMSPLARFALYFRMSMHMLVAGLLMLAVALPTTMADFATAPLIAAVILVAALALPTLGTIELEPDFNTRPRQPVQPWRRVAAIGSATVAAIGVVALLTPPPWRELSTFLISAAALSAAAAVAPWVRYRWVVLIALAVVACAGNPYASFMVLVLGATTILSIWSVRIVKEADRARHLEAALKVSEERLRFAQELHDTLGQHLAAMSLKAEVARALVARNDDRLDTQLTELQALTKTSMAEMREVVEGYRTINLATEIEGACSLLASANIEVTTEGDSFDVPETHRELAAWFLRETATNILKHSQATHARIDLGPDRVTVTNDGVAEAPGAPGGLRALRRRAEAGGSSISMQREGTTFRATLTFEGDPQ